MPREKLIALRKKLLKNVKEELKDRLGKQPADIEKYYNEYRREFKKRYKKVSSKKELLKKLREQDIILCGDYHTLKQAQNTAYKIILELIKKREVVICLELINDNKQEHLDRYIEREINEEKFLKLIKYNKTWGFNWRNYRPIFKVAMNNNLKIYGINRAPDSLQQRDKVAAKNILDISERHQGKLIFVLFGDLHIATPHLPSRVKELMKERKLRKKVFQVFQNSEQIYWQILENEENVNVDVVKLKPTSYCIQNTPPWVKLQSFLIWAEHGDELINRNALSHLKREEEDDDDSDDHFDRADIAKEQFFYILEVLCNFFKVDISSLIDPQIYSVDELYVTEELQSADNITPERYSEIVDQILVRKSFYIPERNIIFLTSYSLNHAAHAATIYIFFQVAGIDAPEGNDFESQRERFYGRVIVDATGFLGSKIINPKRKCFTYTDHQEYYNTHRFSRVPSVVRKKEIAKFTMEHKIREDRVMSGKDKFVKLKSIYDRDAELSFGISKTIGYQLGNALYFAMMYNVIDQPFIFELIKTPLSAENSAFEKYHDLLRRLKNYKPEHMSKTEFF